MRRGTAVVLAALMMVFGALPGLAGERGDAALAEVVDGRPVDGPPMVDRAPDRGVDRVEERPAVRVRPTEVDREIDREIDRYRCVDFVNDRRCIDDRHPHVNVRHLIQRLINAGEWEKLFRLLHRLGII